MNEKQEALLSALMDLARLRIEELAQERDQLRAENEDLRKALAAAPTGICLECEA